MVPLGVWKGIKHEPRSVSISYGRLRLKVLTYLDIFNLSLLLGIQSLEKSRRFDDSKELLGHFEAAVQRRLDPIQSSVYPVQGSVYPAESSIHPIGGSVDILERLIDAHDNRAGALVDDNRVLSLPWGSIDFESFEKRIKRFHLVWLYRFGGALTSRSNDVVLGGLGD